MTLLLNGKSHLCLGFCLILGGTFRIWNFWGPSLWLDEFATHWATSGTGLVDLWNRSVNYSAIPPLYFLVVKLSLSLFGKSEFALRLPSVLAGIMSIFLIYILGKKVFSKEAGILAAWCFSLHPWIIDTSQDARPYALAVFFAVLSSIALTALLQEIRLRNSLTYTLASTALIYSHYLFALFVFYQAAFWFWLALKRRHNERGKAIRLWLLCHATILILLLPAFFHGYLLWRRRAHLQYQIKIDPGYFPGDIWS